MPFLSHPNEHALGLYTSLTAFDDVYVASDHRQSRHSVKLCLRFGQRLLDTPCV